MLNYEKCPVCQSKATLSPELDGRKRYECNRCGTYYLLDSFEPYFSDKSNFYKVSSWIYEQNHSFKTYPELNQEKFEEILKMRDKRIKEKFDLMMKTLVDYDNRTFDKNEFQDKLLVRCWLRDENELNCLYQKAIEKSFVTGSEIFFDKYIYLNFQKLTFDGHEYIEQLDEPNINSKQVFCAFYFSNDMQEIFDNDVKTAIEKCGLTYKRVSSSTTAHDTTINDEIIALIKSSRIVIADFTEHRNSVYFEAGYALGMGIPVIWTCQKGHEKNLSFDTRQYPHIIWDDSEDLKKRLINRIKVLI